jgi:hypothetical protein
MTVALLALPNSQPEPNPPMNSTEITRRIWELLNAGPHSAAPLPEDPSLPIVWADGDADAWRLCVYPGEQMDEHDRALIWREFSAAVNDVIALSLPEGVNVQIIPPHTFPDGQSVEGLVRYVYPPPESAHASAHWWEVISAKLPEVSTLMNARISRQWPYHLEAKRAREPEHIQRARQRLARAQAVEAARQRVQSANPVEQKKRGRSM